MRLRSSLAILSALMVSTATAAVAQAIPPKIWDVPFGTPITGLTVDFADPACGTNGGPPSTPLKSFADFGQCKPEASGLREIWFRYDDTLEYLARALRDPTQTQRLFLTKIGVQTATSLEGPRYVALVRIGDGRLQLPTAMPQE